MDFVDGLVIMAGIMGVSYVLGEMVKAQTKVTNDKPRDPTYPNRQPMWHTRGPISGGYQPTDSGIAKPPERVRKEDC